MIRRKYGFSLAGGLFMACAVASIAWAQPGPIPTREGRNILFAPLALSGRIECDSFVVLPDEIVNIVGDIEIISSGPIVIRGEWNVVAPSAAGRNGSSVTLRSSDRIELWTPITAGRGSDGLNFQQAGGNGGDLSLEAPVIFVNDHMVKVPHGANGGPSGAGGKGSSVFVTGDIVGSDRSHPVEVYAGNGGAAGRASPFIGPVTGANGGDGGDALAYEWMILEANGGTGTTGDAGNNSGPGTAGTNGTSPLGCANGGNATHGGVFFGGHGSVGGVGGNATAPSGTGGMGGLGGKGGNATSSAGGQGGHAGPCCDPWAPGKNGGNGGNGGSAWGGYGGAGGVGGNGLFGAGGIGGTGGDGGWGVGNLGGNGGNGGLGYPTGGSGGNRGLGGTSLAGGGGLGGAGGNGHGGFPMGAKGSQGNDGGHIDPWDGDLGLDGDLCPEI